MGVRLVAGEQAQRKKSKQKGSMYGADRYGIRKASLGSTPINNQYVLSLNQLQRQWLLQAYMLVMNQCNHNPSQWHLEDSIKKLSFENVPGCMMKDLMASIVRKKNESDSIYDTSDFSTMRVDMLRRRLHERGLNIDGTREAMTILTSPSH